MRSSLLEVLVDPVSKGPLRMSANEYGQDGGILEGKLSGEGGQSYPITDGIPRLLVAPDANVQQVGASFGFKWAQRASYESPGLSGRVREWLVQRYGFGTVGAMRRFFAGRRRVLDAGCGSGFSSSLWMDPAWRGEGSAEWVGADLSAAIDIAQHRLGAFPGTHFVQADILQLPFRDAAFDAVYAEGVLHHTPSTECALKAVLKTLAPGGELLFYVYRQKGPVREFTDDYIRGIISRLEPQEAWATLRPLTRLGQALAELRVEVEVPEDIPYLGIIAGRYDVQRLIYWHFAKLYWGEGLTFEESHHVNFDWYHPVYAHRHTEAEVRQWCEDGGLTVIHLDAQESGYTVRAVKG